MDDFNIRKQVISIAILLHVLVVAFYVSCAQTPPHHGEGNIIRITRQWWGAKDDCPDTRDGTSIRTDHTIIEPAYGKFARVCKVDLNKRHDLSFSFAFNFTDIKHLLVSPLPKTPPDLSSHPPKVFQLYLFSRHREGRKPANLHILHVLQSQDSPPGYTYKDRHQGVYSSGLKADETEVSFDPILAPKKLSRSGSGLPTIPEGDTDESESSDEPEGSESDPDKNNGRKTRSESSTSSPEIGRVTLNKVFYPISQNSNTRLSPQNTPVNKQRTDNRPRSKRRSKSTEIFSSHVYMGERRTRRSKSTENPENYPQIEMEERTHTESASSSDVGHVDASLGAQNVIVIPDIEPYVKKKVIDFDTFTPAIDSDELTFIGRIATMEYPEIEARHDLTVVIEVQIDLGYMPLLFEEMFEIVLSTNGHPVLHDNYPKYPEFSGTYPDYLVFRQPIQLKISSFLPLFPNQADFELKNSIVHTQSFYNLCVTSANEMDSTSIPVGYSHPFFDLFAILVHATPGVATYGWVCKLLSIENQVRLMLFRIENLSSISRSNTFKFLMTHFYPILKNNGPLNSMPELVEKVITLLFYNFETLKDILTRRLEVKNEAHNSYYCDILDEINTILKNASGIENFTEDYYRFHTHFLAIKEGIHAEYNPSILRPPDVLLEAFSDPES